jgi:phosphatidylserine decarboxylase
MKHSGKATKAAFKLIFWTLVLLLALLAAGVLGSFVSAVIATAAAFLIGLWIFFAAFTLYFFRDPNPSGPSIANAIVSPAHGKIDVIDETTETEVMGGKCKRLSIFLSVVNVHVQNAPVSGKVIYFKHKPGKFLSATSSHCVDCNENVLIGFEVTDYPNQRVAVRLVAGLIARRIITWIETDEVVPRSERISLIQYGSRCDLYLPLNVKIHAKLGDKVKGGETIVASFD